MFGFNIFQLLIALICFLKLKFNLRRDKLFFYLIYFLCFIGFITHSYYIFIKIIKSDLIENQLYELSDSFEVPNIIFCLKLKQKIDENTELSGNYLEEITKDLEIKNIFERIEYLNESNNNQWIKLERESNYTDHQFKISTYYFLNLKCFQINQEAKYYRDQFYFNDDRKCTYLKLYLNRTFLESFKTVIYFSQN